MAACRVPEMAGDLPVQFADYEDVPVPAAMSRDRAHSLRLEMPAVGSVVNVYRGGALTAGALADHFLRQMPPLGWRLVSRFEQEATILVFEKKATLCFLGIGPDRGITTLSVLVGTLGGAAAPGATQRN
jgi:hypothetical protein